MLYGMPYAIWHMPYNIWHVAYGTDLVIVALSGEQHCDLKVERGFVKRLPGIRLEFFDHI